MAEGKGANVYREMCSQLTVNDVAFGFDISNMIHLCALDAKFWSNDSYSCASWGYKAFQSLSNGPALFDPIKVITGDNSAENFAAVQRAIGHSILEVPKDAVAQACLVRDIVLAAGI